MLTNSVELYLALRRSLGFQLRSHARILRAFASYSMQCGLSHIKTEAAIEWLARLNSPRQRQDGLRAIRNFALHLHAEDPAHEIPPGALFPFCRTRPTPFIYAPDDITRIVRAAAEHLRPRWHAHVWSTLIGLIAVTGMRVSEAIGLRMGDITTDGLVIRQTKYKKSRLLPVHETTKAVLQRYLVRRLEMSADTDHLFLTSVGRPITKSRIGERFNEIRRVTGLVGQPGKSNPRLHDLRHTFAVRSLEHAPRDRTNIMAHMLALSTYLGHTHVSDTYWYLEATPQLLSDITDRCELYVEEVRQ